VKYTSICIAHIRYQTSNALVRPLVIWDHTVLPATRQRWFSRLYPRRIASTHLLTPEGWKADNQKKSYKKQTTTARSQVWRYEFEFEVWVRQKEVVLILILKKLNLRTIQWRQIKGCAPCHRPGPSNWWVYTSLVWQDLNSHLHSIVYRWHTLDISNMPSSKEL